MTINFNLNVVASRPDPRDYQFIASTAPVPSKVDLRNPSVLIKDQGAAGSCTGFASTSCGEWLAQQAITLSPQFCYTTTRVAEARPGQSGTYAIRDVLETARKKGWCLESEMPYIGTEDDTQPSPEAFASGSLRKVERYENIPLGLYTLSTNVTQGVLNIKSALAQGMPVIIALAVGIDLINHKPLAEQNYGPVRIPGWNNYTNTYLGGHAMLILGYDDSLAGFIVQNSWGNGYGDNGYFLIKYQALQDFSEAWVVREFAGQKFYNVTEYEIRKHIVSLYVMILGRAPDVAGMLYWSDLAMNGASLSVLANSIADSDERKTKYPTIGDVFLNISDKTERARYENCVAVAEYCTLDLACNKEEVYTHVLDDVTEDIASVEVAKKWARQHMSGAGGVL